MSQAEETIKARCHPSCRTCANDCLLLRQLKVNGLGLAQLKAEQPGALIPFLCNACDLCAQVCSRKLDPGELMRAWRSELAASEAGLPGSLEPILTDRTPNAYTLYRQRFFPDFSPPEENPAQTAFFPGCALSAYTPDLALRVFADLQQRFPGLAWIDGCCSDILQRLGLDTRCEQARQSLAKRFARFGVRRVVTACPTCQARLSQAYPQLQIVSIYRILADERLRLAGLPARVAVHDSCADRGRQEIGAAVRSLLSNPVKLPHEGKRSACCGAGSGLDRVNPALAAEIGRQRWAEMETAGADLVVTSCVTCAIQLARTAGEIPVTHILDLVYGDRHDYAAIAQSLSSVA